MLARGLLLVTLSAPLEAMKFCSSRWMDCLLYAVGQRLMRN
jgi:hypothetical protein